jgi:bacterioferritin-associated ferredoxin
MLVCHCNGVSDRTIRRAVRDGALTPLEVAHACGAGACCGGCVESVAEIIHAESTRRETAPPLAVALQTAKA